MLTQIIVRLWLCLPYELMGQMFHEAIDFIPVMLHTSWSAGRNRHIGHLQLNIKGAIKIHTLRGIAEFEIYSCVKNDFFLKQQFKNYIDTFLCSFEGNLSSIQHLPRTAVCLNECDASCQYSIDFELKQSSTILIKYDSRHTCETLLWNVNYI